MRRTGFPPAIGPCPNVAILGSMPGVDSLEAAQYYANPRNAFWWIADQLGLAPLALPYEQRLAVLGQRGVALWDVLARCERRGSLDSIIVSSTEVPNDLTSFLTQHPSIGFVFFNGSKAEAVFRKHIRQRLPTDLARRIAWQRLPSTSPANTVLRARKLEAWRVVLEAVDVRPCPVPSPLPGASAPPTIGP